MANAACHLQFVDKVFTQHQRLQLGFSRVFRGREREGKRAREGNSLVTVLCGKEGKTARVKCTRHGIFLIENEGDTTWHFHASHTWIYTSMYTIPYWDMCIDPDFSTTEYLRKS